MKENVVVASVIIGIALVVSALLVSRRDQLTATPRTGRFHVAVGANAAIIVDTVTGQSWEHFLPSGSGVSDPAFSQPKIGKKD